MKTEVLQEFVVVAEELNFTRAANRLYVAQPALTRHIAGLEEEVGAALFRRTTRSVELTAEGQILLDAARRSLAVLNASLREIAQMTQGNEKELRIGFVYTFLSYPASLWVDQFRQARSDVQVQVVQEGIERIPADLLEEALDVGIYGVTDPSFIPDGLQAISFSKETEEIIVGRGHRLAGRDSVTVHDLEGEQFVYPFVMPTRVYSPLWREVEEKGVSVSVRQAGFESSALETVERGEAIIGLPTSHPEFENDVVAIPMESDYCITSYVVWNPKNPKRVIGDFVAYVQSVL